MIGTSRTQGYVSSDAYDFGYDHGCDDAGISDPGDRYINQPEKGTTFHTGTFMRGYNDGFDACSDSSEGGNGSPSDTSSGSAGRSVAGNYADGYELGKERGKNNDRNNSGFDATCPDGSGLSFCAGYKIGYGIGYGASDILRGN